MIFRLIFFVDDIRENASDIGIKQHNIFRILKRNIMEDIDSIVNYYDDDDDRGEREKKNKRIQKRSTGTLVLTVLLVQRLHIQP